MAHCDVPADDGAILKASIEGSGPDLVLVSGLGGTAAFWDPVVAALEQHFRVIRFNQRGLAGSSRGTARCTIEQLASDCLEVFKAVGAASTLLVGHSTGGCIAQTVATMAPDRLKGIVLSATWLSPSRYMRELFRIRLALLQQMPREYAAAGIFLGYPAEWINSHWTHFEATAAKAPMDDASRALVEERIEALLAFDGHHLVGKSGLPHLILGAADDMVVPAFLQRELALAIPAAEATFLESGGHFFPITRTKEFVQLVTSWADQAGRR